MSYYHMIDVSKKASTLRIAIASGKIYVGVEVFNLIKAGEMIKGDPLRLAEVAAIMGAKNVSQLIPLCHPLSLDKVEFKTQLQEEDFSILVYCIVITNSKTGVEMEALAGVSTGLLTIYDLSKISNPELKISDIQLLLKIGGKSGLWQNPKITELPLWVNDYIPPAELFTKLKIASITLSDRASAGYYEDKSGLLLQELIIKAQAINLGHQIIPDHEELIVKALKELIYTTHQKPHIIITTGGTGISPCDITPEALAKLQGREITGLGELLRFYGSQFTQFSYLSRSKAVIINQVVIIALPGSPKAVVEGFNCLKPLLTHLVKMASGGKHD